jgi:UDP-3-O-[3-hydroxymyristoyl] glucosamine N-acyltransferase
MYESLWNMCNKYDGTCSIFHPVDNHITFSKTEKNLKYIKGFQGRLLVLVPYDIECFNNPNIRFYRIEDENVTYVFAKIHNEINKNRARKTDIIHPSAYIHETAIIGIHGNTYIDNKNGTDRINLKHIGNVIIEDNVDIEALSIVHRAGMDSTIIKSGVKLGVMCKIGHNCYIGKNTILAAGVKLGGHVTVGENCYLWQNVVTRGNINICDNVIIGANSYVHNDIKEPGVYFGTPAVYIKPYDKNIR